MYIIKLQYIIPLKKASIQNFHRRILILEIVRQARWDLYPVMTIPDFWNDDDRTYTRISNLPEQVDVDTMDNRP